VPLVVLHLPRDSFHQRPVLLEAFAALLQLGNRQVVFILHLGDGIGGPEDVCQLVHLRPQRSPKFAEYHDGTLPMGGGCA
jgi:hypothetical protein